MVGYTEYDEVKIKLRISDDSMLDEIQLYMDNINDLIDNRLRAKLGQYNVYGARIILPLTHATIPIVPIELKAIANDLVVAKLRLQNSEKPLLWDSAVKILDNYLDMVYGWTQNKAFQPTRTLTTSPATGIIGSTITISGTNFQPSTKLKIYFDASEPITNPVNVMTNTSGVFTSSTFVVPNNQPNGSYDIKVVDDFGGIGSRFQVTS